MMATTDTGATLPHAEPPVEQGVRPAAFSDVLPIDRSVPFYPELYPRDPDAYEPLDHFYQRQKEDERMLERELDGFSAVRQTIIQGIRGDNGDGCCYFELDWYGVTFYVVVGFHLKGYRIAVSGWPMLWDRHRAEQSGRWGTDELDTIEAFNNEHFANKP